MILKYQDFHNKNCIEIDNDFVVNEEYKSILGYSEFVFLKAVGTINLIEEEININLNVSALLKIPCALTFKPVTTNLDFEIHELEEFSKDGDFNLNDYLFAVLMSEIPIRVVSEDVDYSSLKGDNWQVIKEEEVSTTNQFDKLKDLLEEVE